MNQLKALYRRYKKEITIGGVIVLLLLLLLLLLPRSSGNSSSSTSLPNSGFTSSEPTTSNTTNSSTPLVDVTVTFDLQGGSSGDPLTRTGTPGQPLTVPNATFTGYTLLGYDEDALSETGSSSLVFPNEDTTYYAIWDANAYRVTFNQLSGSILKYDNTLFASLFINGEGDVYALGQNRAGIYGNGSTSSVNNSTPYLVSQHLLLNEGETVVDLAIQSSNVSDYAFLLTSDDRVLSAGNASFGLVGNNETSGIVSTYVDITPSFNLSDGERIIQISPGQFVAGALSSTGRVFVWGNRTHLGFIDNNVPVVSATPVDVTSAFDDLLNPNETIGKLEIGAFAGYAFTNQDRIFAWGTSTNGSFAFNKTLTTATPIDLTPDFLALMNPNETLFDLSFRDRYGLLQTSEGRVFDWGDYR